jgi:hypothetical protein
MKRLVFEMCVFPKAQRRQINPIDVMREYPDIPNNLKETGYNAMALLLRAVETNLDLGVTINDFLHPAKRSPNAYKIKPSAFAVLGYMTRAFYQRLLDAGKVRKLALTAAMRKLLVTLNAPLRDGQPWRASQSA